MTYGYDADVMALCHSTSHETFRGHAERLLTAVVTAREDSQTSSDIPIVFVAHSLGGLVCQDALNIALIHDGGKALLEATKGVIFMGTPHCGSGFQRIAKTVIDLAKIIGRHVEDSYINVLNETSERLINLEDDFQTMLRYVYPHINQYCFYEDSDYPYVGRIVSKDSATLLGIRHDAINAHHINMTKFPSRDDKGYEKFKHALRYVVGDSFRPKPTEAFFEAIRHDDAATVKASAKSYASEILDGYAGKDHLTAVSYAAEHATVEALRVLLADCGAKPDLPDAKWHQRPLLRAAKGSRPGHIKIVEHLLNLNIHGRDEDVVVDAMDDDDQTALAVAAEFGNMEIVRQLLEAGADRDRCSMEGRTPLSRAREKSHADIVAILER